MFRRSLISFNATLEGATSNILEPASSKFEFPQDQFIRRFNGLKAYILFLVTNSQVGGPACGVICRGNLTQ